MNICVCVKHAIDESELKADGRGKPQLQGAQTKVATFDRNGIEEAVRIRETKGGTVTVLTLGESDARKSMKEALAMGADKAYLVNANPAEHDTLTTSYFLSRAIEKLGGFDLVITSEGSSDTYNGQVGPMIAEWLALPYVGYARKITPLDRGVICEEALEDMVQVVEAPLPAVISVVSEINEPRYPTLLQIIQASKKPMEEVELDSLREADSPAKAVEVTDVTVQSTTRKRIIFEGSPDESTKKLLEALSREGVLK